MRSGRENGTATVYQAAWVQGSILYEERQDGSYEILRPDGSLIQKAGHVGYFMNGLAL